MAVALTVGGVGLAFAADSPSPVTGVATSGGEPSNVALYPPVDNGSTVSLAPEQLRSEAFILFRDAVDDFAICLRDAGFFVLGPLPSADLVNYDYDHTYVGDEELSAQDVRDRSEVCYQKTLAEQHVQWRPTEEDKDAMFADRVAFIGCVERRTGIDIADLETTTHRNGTDEAFPGADVLGALIENGEVEAARAGVGANDAC